MRTLFTAAALTLAIASPALAQSAPAKPAASTKPLEATTAIYELRTYYPQPGKLPNVNARFRDHTLKFFAKYGMRSVAYWNDAPTTAYPDGRLIYILAYPSMEAREASWAAFRADPAWRAVVTASEANGKLLVKTESIFMTMTDYSPKLTLPK